MSNLYPPPAAAAGSFDDYDSIIDETFSIGRLTNASDDVSSMQLSEMGGVSVLGNAATTPSATPATSPARSRSGRADPVGAAATAAASGIEGRKSPAGAIGDVVWGGGAAQFVPASSSSSKPAAMAPSVGTSWNESTIVHESTILKAGTAQSPQRSDASSSLRLGSDTSGFYHVGDTMIGTTDVSAILGAASAASGDDDTEDDPLNDAVFEPTNDNSEDAAADLLPTVAAAKSDAAFENVFQAFADADVEGGGGRRRLGPLGDEMSYAGSPSEHEHIMCGDDDYESDEESEAHRGLLPDWISAASGRTKCVFISSTAFVLGAVVLVIVALGVSYGWGAGGGEGPEEANAPDQVLGEPAGDPAVPDFPFDDILVQETGYTPEPTASPLWLGLEQAGMDLGTLGPSRAPVLSDAPTPTVTDDALATPSPTVSAEPSVKASAAPSGQASEAPSAAPTTLTMPPTSSAAPTDLSSPPPSVSMGPTAAPSEGPSHAPSSGPSASSQPSWSFGAEAAEEGDVTFYLMADGGSNFAFWADKLGNLQVENQLFLAHLGSATRKVDDCAETAFYGTQLALSTSPVPVYSVPGNNDYPQCSDPDAAFGFYKQHMMNITTTHWNATEGGEYVVKRQVDSGREENFSFLYKRVLFIGLNMVSNDADAWEHQERLDDNVDWVVSNVEAYRNNVDAVFVMGYGRLQASANAALYNALVWRKENEWDDLLLVYARRAAETGIERDVNGISDFAELKVGNEWPILDVRVRTKGNARVEYRNVADGNDGPGGGGGGPGGGGPGGP